MTNRRQFLQTALGAAGLLGWTAATAGRAQGAIHSNTIATSAQANVTSQVTRAPKPLKILFLGGTGFIGPHEIEYALARGHEVTMFNRGSKAGLYGDRVEEIVGNRDAQIDDGLKGLEGDRTWDVIVDNSGYVPRHVRDSVALLKERTSRYIYVSTVAVYDFDAAHEFAEDGPLAKLDDPAVEEVTGATYGPLKAECDRIVRRELGDRSTVVRPAYIIGPGDTTDRFTYWVDRIHQGGDVVGPPNREVSVQFVDVRDLCPWIIGLGENDTPGTFNAAAAPWTRAGLLWGIRATTTEAVRFHWPTAELAAELEMPVPMLNWGEVSNSFANAASLGAGQVYRPLAESALGTLQWWRGQSQERRDGARGWPAEGLEAKLLERLG